MPEKESTESEKVASPGVRSSSQIKSGSPVSRESPSVTKVMSGSSTNAARSPASGKVSSSGSRGKPSRNNSTKSETRKSATQEKNERTAAIDMPGFAPEVIEHINEMSELPEGCAPIFLSALTQKVLHLVVDSDVTEEQPIKLVKKSDIEADLFKRAAVCDFAPVKGIIKSYQGDHILVGYDYNFKFGENFYFCKNEEVKEFMLNPPPKEKNEEGDKEEEEEEEEDTSQYKYVPPESKPWVSLGSDREIAEYTVREDRPLIKFVASRRRDNFMAPPEFTDVSAEQVKDACQNITSFSDAAYNLHMLELEKGVQGVPKICTTHSQTEWKRRKNAAVQYQVREYSEEEAKKRMKDPQLRKAFRESFNRFEVALQQNEIMNPFVNDWLQLTGEEDGIGSEKDIHLKEYQSFTDLRYSKNKCISHVEWHPTIKGVIAVSITEAMTFDERIENEAKVNMTPSLILLWSFTDPINPQLILEAPYDVLCFKFNPSNPNIICGGCLNGQLVLWDMTSAAPRIKTQSSKKKKTDFSLPGLEDMSKTLPVRYCAVSSIKDSHTMPIHDILWIPDHMEINNKGEPKVPMELKCVQILTAATDSCLFLWDTRPLGKSKVTPEEEKRKELSGISTTFLHLDFKWKPRLQIYLHKSEPGGDHAPTRFSISEVQGNRAQLLKAVDFKEKDLASTNTGQFVTQRPNSAKQKMLNNVLTHFYAGTEDGEVVYADWMLQKDQDTGKVDTPKPDWYHAVHDGPIIAAERCSFFRDIILFVGGWNFTIWKEGVSSGPILSSPMADVRLTSAAWSPTRPLVFFIGRHDGKVDIWDLLDKTHEPMLSQNITSSPITCIKPKDVTPRQQLLAMSDAIGTLHILEVPHGLKHSTADELQTAEAYIEREVSRRAFVIKRWAFREQEKREIEAEAKKRAGFAADVQLTQDEVDKKLNLEYKQYLDMENQFLLELGLKVEEEEPEPPIPA